MRAVGKAMADEQPKALVAGNWKMNGTTANLKELRLLGSMLKGVRLSCDVMVCPPATLIPAAAGLKLGRVAIGGQDCHAKVSGAHTGDISAAMLKDVGAGAVIVGHSERRADHGETDAMVRDKASAAHQAGLMAIVCVGETLAERKAGDTIKVVGGQVKGSLPKSADAANTVIAYEPVWAIGSGLTPTVEQVAEVHKAIRSRLARLIGKDEAAKVRILYGGSVKPANAEELMAVANVDGALVGGASLKAADFVGIIKVYA